MKVSVITICLNEAKGIKDTIESVVNQEFRDFEYIVVDGNSTDGTREIIEKFRKNIDVFISEKDEGIYSAMNKGLSYSKGEYIIFLNGGDHFYNYNVLSDVFRNKITKPIFYGYCETTTSKNTPTLFRAPKRLTRLHLAKTSIPHQATFVKRELFQKYGNFDESYKLAGDYDFLLRLVVKHSIQAQYIPVLCSYFDKNGISSTLHELREVEKRKARQTNFSAISLKFYTGVNILIDRLRLIKRSLKIY